MFKADSGTTGIQLPTTYSRGIREVKVMDNRKEPPFFNEDNMGLGPFDYKLLFYDTMELFIETLTGTCFELRVSPFEAVISVKAKIQRLEGIPICQQHLIWNNVELEDDYCLNDYNISEGCTLKLVLAMRGGPINTRKVPTEDPLREMAECMDPRRDEVWEKASCSRQVTFLVYREGDQLNFFRVVDRGDGTLTPLSESLSGSMYNLCTDEEEEVEPSPSGQKTIENSITMNKMKLLKAKMENMNLGRKPKRALRVQPHPPATRPVSGSTGVGPRPRLLPALTPLSPGRLPGPSQLWGTQHSTGNLVTEDMHDSVLEIPCPEQCAPENALHPEEAQGSTTGPGCGMGIQGKQRDSAVSQSPSLSPPRVAAQSPGDSGIPGKPHRQPRVWDCRAAPEPTVPSAATSCGCRGVKVRSPGKRPDVISRVEARDITEMANKAVKEPVGRVSNVGLLASLARSASRDGVQSARGPGRLRPPRSRLQPETPSPCGSTRAQPSSPFPSALGLRMNRSSTAAGKRGGECPHHLPPMKAPLQTKKKTTTKHCFLCGKKTGLATSYECRCGNNFCASHRYAETHGCTYDYKSTGRRFLQEANPVVKAPKLPKI
ncbi:PREDICTED: AN1-type zinc finger protein 4 isoform X2 [Chinchilla lanigera]|uniref:AN1-type zinc finger protein 4 isoform X2 n=1 Tax=Chinchilla lanigera TaxID=34839 RepID=UPI00038EDFA5|nr:PREDICTED: AN1-type zinc finger protein 4 isoform X2 [Chinchilla lanigera]